MRLLGKFLDERRLDLAPSSCDLPPSPLDRANASVERRMAPNTKVPVPARDCVEVAGLPEQPIDQFLEKPHGRGSRHL